MVLCLVCVSPYTFAPNAAAARVATDVECAMDDNTPYLRKKDDYLAKARQLAFNLKKNEQLRCDIHRPCALLLL